MSKLSDNVLQLHGQGMNADEICEVLGCSKAFVLNITGVMKRPVNHDTWSEEKIREWRRVTAVILRAFNAGVPMPQYYIDVRKMNKERGTYEKCD